MAEAAIKMTTREPFLWEKSYPAGVSWDIDLPAQSLPAMLDASIARFPNNPCVDFLDKKFTYAQIGSLVDRFAAGLQKMGLKKGQKVGLFLPNTPYSVICFFGILKAGGTVVNYNPSPT